MRKMMACVLAFCLLLGLLPTAAFAAESAEPSSLSAEVEEVVEPETAEEEAEIVQTIEAEEAEIVQVTEAEEEAEIVQATEAEEETSIGKSTGIRVSLQPDASDKALYARWKAALHKNSDAASLLDVNGNEFTNEYLSTYVLNSGLFTMGTTGGKPGSEYTSDDNVYLLYGHRDPWSSKTIIRIDGVDYYFNGDPDVPTTRYDEYSETVRTIAGVKVTQTLTFVNNPQTGRKDIVQIRYSYTNLSESPKEIGVRIMLDTMLSYNDGAPFRVGEDQVTYEREYEGDAIPQYWICFDQFENPNVIATGTLYTNVAKRPSKVQFANWGDIFGAGWNYEIDENRYMGDTSVAVYFDPAAVASGASGEVETYYGLSDVVPIPDPPGNLLLNVVRPAALEAGAGDYENNPFVVTAYAKNTGGSPLANVKLNLDLTSAGNLLELVEGEGKIIESLAANEEAAVQWTLRANRQEEETTVSYRITGDYDEQEEQTVVDLETTLAALPLFHTANFAIPSDGDTFETVASFQVADGGDFAESAAPAVPEKAPDGNYRYEGYWDWESISYWDSEAQSLTNITDDVTVEGKYNAICSVESLTIDPDKAELHIGVSGEDTIQLAVNVLPEEAEDKTVTWLSHNKSVATVSSSGLVKAVAVGTATITATSNSDPSISAACLVTVEAVLTGIEVTQPHPWEMEQGSPLSLSNANGDRLIVEAVYSDNTKTEVTDYTLTGYDPNPEGLGFGGEDDEGQPIPGLEYKDEELTVSYKDCAPKTCVVRVIRSPRVLESIMIQRTPTKRLNYVQGDRLNLDGMILGLTYNSGEVENLPEFADGNIPEGVEVTGYNPQQLGNQAITISYGGKSMQFSIRVLPGPTGTAEKNLIQPRVSIENKMDGTKGGYKLVTLSCPDGASDIPTGTIYYTTNGDTPTNRSTPYNENEPIRVEETTTIKAIAINGSNKSAVTSALVSLPQVSAPIVANLHHRNNQGLNRSMTELEPGTLVSLISDTSAATIFYWIEGKLGSAEDSRYGTSIYMKPEYADAQGNVVLKAYAAKDGYQNSTVTTLRYHLNIQETPFETATVSLGNVSSRAGELVSPTLNINSTDEGKLTNFHVKIAYDSGALSFVSVNPLQSGTQVFSANSTNGRSGEVTVQYNGTTPLDAGEVCTLNFRALDSSEDQRYDLTIDQEEITINTDTNSPMVYDFMDGWVTLLGSHNSQLTATTDIVAVDGSEINNIGNLEAGTEVQARVTIDLPTASASGDAALQAAEDQLRVLNVFVAIYDGNDAMVNLETWDIDVTDPTNLQTVRRLRINRSVTGGRVRFMLMSDTMVPAAASNLLSSSTR